MSDTTNFRKPFAKNALPLTGGQSTAAPRFAMGRPRSGLPLAAMLKRAIESY